MAHAYGSSYLRGWGRRIAGGQAFRDSLGYIIIKEVLKTKTSQQNKTIWMCLLGPMWDLGCWAASHSLSSPWTILQWSELMRMLEKQTLIGTARLHPPFPPLPKKEKNKMLPSVG